MEWIVVLGFIAALAVLTALAVVTALGGLCLMGACLLYNDLAGASRVKPSVVQRAGVELKTVDAGPYTAPSTEPDATHAAIEEPHPAGVPAVDYFSACRIAFCSTLVCLSLILGYGFWLRYLILQTRVPDTTIFALVYAPLLFTPIVATMVHALLLPASIPRAAAVTMIAMVPAFALLLALAVVCATAR